MQKESVTEKSTQGRKNNKTGTGFASLETAVILLYLEKVKLNGQPWLFFFCFFAFQPGGQCRDTSSAADFVLDISMIHAWCDAWPGGLQNLY